MSITPAERAKNAVHLEIMVVSYRCYQILRAYPDDADEITRTRFSHGLGREMWIAMTAIGVMLGAEISGGLEKHVPTLGIVGHLLKRTDWHGLSLSIDIGHLDRKSICKVYDDKAEHAYDVQDALALVGNPWWKLVSSPVDAALVPPWWEAPTMLVIRPMPIWAQDDIAASAEVSVIEAITTDVLDMSKKRRDVEEALRQQTTRAVAAQLKEEDDLWMKHDAIREVE